MTGPGTQLQSRLTRGRRATLGAGALLASLAIAAPAGALPYAPGPGHAFHGVNDTGDPADFQAFAEQVGAHPAVMQTFHTWGTFPSMAMMRWDAADARGMISISTAKGYEEPEVLSPEAI